MRIVRRNYGFSFYPLGNELNFKEMALTIIREGQLLSPMDCQFLELNKFCSEENLSLTLEWIRGQFWLHSDVSYENPIGIEIDGELERHLDFFKKSSLQKELLAKAVGIKSGYRPKVLDLTAGMLGDSLLLLSFGCEVWAVERHPVIRFLISSALHNAKHPLLNLFHFIPSDANSVLSENLEMDVLYFDPMFEDPNEKTAPKKEMRIFRSLVGKDHDAEDVFIKSISKRCKRLVVKRPRHSGVLSLKPSVQYVGKSTRYDVYFSL
jgi:16S rRNA (guanine1516-N2)-methyltransferase